MSSTRIVTEYGQAPVTAPGPRRSNQVPHEPAPAATVPARPVPAQPAEAPAAAAAPEPAPQPLAPEAVAEPPPGGAAASILRRQAGGQPE